MKSRLLLAALFVPLLAVSSWADMIVLRDGREISGVTVEKETFQQVDYRRGRANQNVPSDQVRSITYTRTSPEFIAGMAALARGENLSAAEQLATAADDENLGAHIRASALIEVCDALLAQNYFDDALTYYDMLLSEYPESRHLARALLGRGRALFLAGSFDEAQTAFERLQSEAASKGLGERWGLEAQFYEIWAAEARNPAADVADRYRALRTKVAAVDTALANRCALNLGRTLLRNQEFERAESIFQEIIDKRLASEADVVAGAFNGRGEVRFARALAQIRDQNAQDHALDSFREARLDFLRVYTRYRGVSREQPKALYFAGQCYLNIGTLDASEVEANFQGRALLNRLRIDYPSSPEAKLASS